MREAQVGRLRIVELDEQLVGMRSLGDIATRGKMGEACETLELVFGPSRPNLKFLYLAPEFFCSINHLRWISGLGF